MSDDQGKNSDMRFMVEGDVRDMEQARHIASQFKEVWDQQTMAVKKLLVPALGALMKPVAQELKQQFQAAQQK